MAAVISNAAAQVSRTYYLAGLHCAGCAAKIEKEARGLSGVQSAQISLAVKKLMLSHGEDANTQRLDEEVISLVSRIENGVRTVCLDAHGGEEEAKAHAEHHAHSSQKTENILLAAGAALFAAAIGLSKWQPGLAANVLLIIAYIVLGAPVIQAAARGIMRRDPFDESFLMSIATVGALLIGDYAEAGAVMLFYRVGEALQHGAVERSRDSIRALVALKPESVHLLLDGQAVSVPPAQVQVGDTIEVRPGERVPLDGQILTGQSSVNTAALTGESLPRAVEEGDMVDAGSINGQARLTLKVVRPFAQSAVMRILEMTENAAAQKANTELLLTRFARVYTPVVVILSALVALVPPLLGLGSFGQWIYRGLLLLVISCPCALVLSVPLTFFAGIGAMSRKGVLVKGGQVIEQISRITAIAFDKTGTLTDGDLVVDKVVSYDPELTGRDILGLAAALEQKSSHPIAKTLMAAAKGRSIDLPPISAQEYREVPGEGVLAQTGQGRYLVGGRRLMERQGVNIPAQAEGAVYLALDQKLLGGIGLEGRIRQSAPGALSRLRAMGVQKIAMLTGDEPKVAQGISQKLGIADVHAGLTPEGKLLALDGMKQGHTVAFVGDGINDAPVLASADVGFAMGGIGSDAAIEAADAVLLTDEPQSLCQAISISRKVMRIAAQNVTIALLIKAAAVLLGIFGVATMWMAVIADVGAALLCVTNTLRILWKNEN